MKVHVDLVGSLYVVWGMLSLMVGLALLSLGLGAAALAGPAPGGEVNRTLAAGIAAATFLTLAAVVLLWAIIHLWSGRALGRHKAWARAVGLVLGVLNLFLLPFGTALGVYTLWVLMHDDTRPLFDRARD